MSLRGEAQRAAIRSVVEAFGDDAAWFVFVGGCTLGLYASTEGAPLRVTKDVDCISMLSPWVLQEKKLADMCSRGVLIPDANLQCRYRIGGLDVDVDVLSPDGFNVGGVNPWFARLFKRVDAEGIRPDIAKLWGRALKKYDLAESDVPDLVDWHLDRREGQHRNRVVDALVALVRD